MVDRARLAFVTKSAKSRSRLRLPGNGICRVTEAIEKTKHLWLNPRREYTPEKISGSIWSREVVNLGKMFWVGIDPLPSD
ncbi:MAG: hypothetical protein HC851_15820 [Acaryochloris sp. RU_4_1]|nr:hypothetical protein [Acaryochloris sp. RU_4_1]